MPVELQWIGPKVCKITWSLVEGDSCEFALLAAEAGHTNLALDIYNRLLRDDLNDADAWYGQAKIFDGRKNLREAERCYRAAISSRPDFVDAFCALGAILIQKSEDEEAMECYRKVIAIHPKSAVAHFHLGNLCEAAGNKSEALEHFVASFLYYKPGDNIFPSFIKQAINRLRAVPA